MPGRATSAAATAAGPAATVRRSGRPGSRRSYAPRSRYGRSASRRRDTAARTGCGHDRSAHPAAPVRATPGRAGARSRSLLPAALPPPPRAGSRARTARVGRHAGSRSPRRGRCRRAHAGRAGTRAAGARRRRGSRQPLGAEPHGLGPQVGEQLPGRRRPQQPDARRLLGSALGQDELGVVLEAQPERRRLRPLRARLEEAQPAGGHQVDDQHELAVAGGEEEPLGAPLGPAEPAPGQALRAARRTSSASRCGPARPPPPVCARRAGRDPAATPPAPATRASQQRPARSRRRTRPCAGRSRRRACPRR